MTLFQFWTVLAFVATCIVVTWLNSRKMLSLRKQRDELANTLLSLMQNVSAQYPEGVHYGDESMLKARRVLASVVRSEKQKNSFLEA